jgi:hypothetical protein
LRVVRFEIRAHIYLSSILSQLRIRASGFCNLWSLAQRGVCFSSNDQKSLRFSSRRRNCSLCCNSTLQQILYAAVLMKIAGCKISTLLINQHFQPTTSSSANSHNRQTTAAPIPDREASRENKSLHKILRISHGCRPHPREVSRENKSLHRMVPTTYPECLVCGRATSTCIKHLHLHQTACVVEL